LPESRDVYEITNIKLVGKHLDSSQTD